MPETDAMVPGTTSMITTGARLGVLLTWVGKHCFEDQTATPFSTRLACSPQALRNTT